MNRQEPTAGDRIDTVVELAAPVARVWRALTDYQEFGEWFRVKLDGPFRPGALSTGAMTYPGYEGWPWRATVERMEPERLFSFRWYHDDKPDKPCAATPKVGTSRRGTSRPMSPRPAELIPADAAPVFAALGDSTRLRLLSRLKDGQPRSLVQLTDGSGLTRQGVSKHLRVLERAGMVSSRRKGRESRFVFEPAGIAQARKHLERASRQWDEAAVRLQAFLKDGPGS